MLRRTLIIEAATGALVIAASLAACAGADRRQSLLDSLRRDSSATSVIAANTARATADSARLASDSSALHAPAPPPSQPTRSRPLGEAERAIADYAVFAPRTQQWFIAAVRARHLLVDIGRYDGKVGGDAAWRRALATVARVQSPIDTGSLFRVRGPWGVDTVSVSGFDVYHGRLVATLVVPPSLDSIVRRQDGAGTAERIAPPAPPPPADTTTATAATASSSAPPAPAPPPATAPRSGAALGGTPPAAAGTAAPPAAAPRDTTPACSERDTLATPLAQRVVVVRDSLVRWITDSIIPPVPRLAKANRIQGWTSAGCFGAARAMVIVSRRNETGELTAERALLVGPNGELTRLRVLDLRFHAHDPLFVTDVDGDGIDDLVARGYGSFSGATTALRLDPAAKTLKRVAAGFAWESR